MGKESHEQQNNQTHNQEHATEKPSAPGVVLGAERESSFHRLKKSIKREEWWAIAVVATIVAIPMLWFWPSVTERAPVQTVSLNACGYASNEEAMQDAIDQVDVALCDCIERSTNLKENCQTGVTDIALYLEAIEQNDSALCAPIDDIAKRTACVNIVDESVRRLTEDEPQFLADQLNIANNSDAIPLYEALLEGEPDDVTNLLALSYAYAHRGLEAQESGHSQVPDVEAALTLIERAQALEPENAEVYRAYGYAYEVLPDTLKAIENYDQAIALDPQNILSYTGRGHTHVLNGNLAQALEDYQKAAALDVNGDVYEIYEGLCQLESSNSEYYDAAVEHCSIITDATGEVSPVVRSNAHQMLSTVLLAEGDVDGAEAELLAAKALTPEDSNLYVSLANIAIAHENFEEVKAHAGTALQHSTVKAAAYSVLAYAEFKLGNFDAAIEAAEVGLAQIDEDISLLTSSRDAFRKDMYHTLANVYYNIGDTEKEAEYKALGDQL